MEGSIEHRSRLRLNIPNKRRGAYRRKPNRKSRRERRGKKRLYIKVQPYYYRSNNSNSVGFYKIQRERRQKLSRAGWRDATGHLFLRRRLSVQRELFRFQLKSYRDLTFRHPSRVAWLRRRLAFGIKKIQRHLLPFSASFFPSIARASRIFCVR